VILFKPTRLTEKRQKQAHWPTHIHMHTKRTKKINQ